MPSDGAAPAAMPIIRRFWLLVALVLAVAIVSSAFAVRGVAVPFLQSYQNEVVEDQAAKAARELEARLQNLLQLMTFAASDPDTVNVALGYSDNADHLPDLLAALPTPEEMSWVTFLDAFGETLSTYDVRGEERGLFSDDALRDMADVVLQGAPGEPTPLLIERKGTSTHLVLAIRVARNGLTEGLLLAGYRLDLSAVFPVDDIVERTYLLALGEKPRTHAAGVTVAPLSSLPLAVALVPDLAVVEAVGDALLAKSVGAVAAVLLCAFGLLALLGKAVIVEPHRQLEQQARTLEAQAEELSRLAAIAQRANDAFCVVDLQGRLQWVNAAFERITGHALDEVRNRRADELLSGPDTDPRTVARISAALQQRKPIQAEVLTYAKSGTPFWMNLSVSLLETAESGGYAFVAIFYDITEARRQRDAILAAKREIEHQALHDPLTGLPNRRALDAAMTARAAEPCRHTTLVRIDLDNFKYVNDTLGHEAGDFVLCEVARILREETKAGDIAARVGGDEFVLLLAPDATVEDGSVLARRMLGRIRAPKQFENRIVRFGASFGIAGTEGGLVPLGELIIAADAALYDAKAAGRNRVHLYTPELHKQVLYRRTLAVALRRAVASEEFEPFFQPQFDARTFEIAGVETLARWRSPELGLIEPDQFLPVATQLSIVEEIDDIIFRKAIAQIRSLNAEGVVIPKVSLNVTAARIQELSALDSDLQHSAGLPKIAFEVLESVLVEEQNERFRWGLDRLRDAGIRIEVDDFGSGHASIIGLLHLRPDAMKVDQRLVRPIADDPVACKLLEKIVGMADLMQLTVVAEGVETLRHAELLREMGCDVLQGYAFCEPMDIAALRVFAREHLPEALPRRLQAKQS